MAQDDTMDFKALRARFQEERLLSQPRLKPALPEKPKVVPPPHSPTQYLPPGARPSLLTSINFILDKRTVVPPKVVFKDEKKSSMDQNGGTLQASKGKQTEGHKEPLDENSLYHKLKKDIDKDKKPPRVTTAELVSVPALTKAPNSKKKGFLGSKWSAKTHPEKVLADSILDAPTFDGPALVPLIPIPPEFDDVEPEAEILPPNIFSSSDSDLAFPISPGFTPPPSFIPDFPAFHLLSPESETPPEFQTGTLPLSLHAGHGRMSRVQNSPSIYQTVSIPPPEIPSPLLSSPEPDYGVPGNAAGISIAALLNPRTRSASPSLPAEGSASALSALERAEDMSQGKRNTATDGRILNALQKARNKPNHSSQKNGSVSSTPPPEELHLPHSPQELLADLPPINYNSRARHLNSLDPGEDLLSLEDTDKYGTEDVLADVLPPHPRSLSLDRAAPGVPPEKPPKPSLIKIPDFIPPSPPIIRNAIPVPSKLPEMQSTNGPQFGGVASGGAPGLAGSQWVNGSIPDGNQPSLLYSNGPTMTGPKGVPVFPDKFPVLPPSHQADASYPTSLEGQAMAGAAMGNYNEPLYSAKGKSKTEVGRKKKGPPKNPYAEAGQEFNEENNKTAWFGKGDKKSTTTAEVPDDKELKKREKQRLEKERKELKEKQEREKKEQKEREKRANEMKKKYKVTGSEEAMYHATVTVTTKGRKDDLPLQSGDVISIIRTTNCPKGKWLARDSGNNYGYVAVDHVELDIKEMLELGRKASGTRVGSPMDEDGITTSIRTSNHYPQSTESFSDDSEEWTVDDDDAFPHALVSQNRALSVPDMGNADVGISHQHSRSDISAGGPNVQASNEALQKLATFFHSPNAVKPSARKTTEAELGSALDGGGHVVQHHRPYAKEFEQADLLILPPPELYADDSE